MSLNENVRDIPSAKPAQPLQAPEIANKLESTQAELAQLEGQHGVAALDATTDDPAATERLADIQRKLTAARERVANLTAAHKVAIERDAANLRAQRAALQKTQIAAVRKHLEARDTAAIALSAAISEATKQFHILLDRSAKAQAACPVGINWPRGAGCEPDPLRRMVSHEMCRLSVAPGNRDGRSLPGPELPGMQFEWNPGAIPPLCDELKKSSEYVIGHFTGKIVG